jgi:2'-5' RNA ligase
MKCDPDDQVPINSYALVSYIPEPLGSFLNRLRSELVPACSLQSHVTILPPRPLSSTPEDAWQMIRSHANGTPPFEILLKDVKVFEVTSVVYISVDTGWDELKRLHALFNRDGLEFTEPYSYHPHITVAQDFGTDRVAEVAEVARRRWADFPHQRTFRVETLSFVQNTNRNRWLDLGDVNLDGPP